MLIVSLGFIIVSALESVPIYDYTIINTIPHSGEDYTQGLEFDSTGNLWQSTGLYGRSKLQKFDITDASKAISQISLNTQYFGEGLTILNERIYQLTWQERKIFTYSMDLKLIESRRIPDLALSGWGLCNDGEALYMTDGTANIYKFDPLNLGVLSSVQVNQNGVLVDNLNELEWVNGEIWANLYFSKYIARINPENGAILGWINLTGLEKSERKLWDAGYVLNGIAVYNNRIYVTGKFWDSLYEISISTTKSTTFLPKLR